MKELCGDGQGNQIVTAGCRQVQRELWDVVVLSDRMHLLKHMKQPPLVPYGQMARGWDDPFDSYHLQEWQHAGFRLRENPLCYTSQPSNFFGIQWWRPRFGWQWRSSSEAVQASPMYSKADATVVTMDHPNIRAHTSNRVVEQPFIKSGRSQQYFFSVRKEERHQRNDTCRGFTGMCACSMASTSSF